MLLIWIPVSVLAMYFVLNIVYGKLWKNGLQAELRFEERDVEEGDETILVETVTNDKFLPLPEAQMDRFLMKLSIGLPDEENECRIMARSLARMNRTQGQENGGGHSTGQETRRSSWETDISPAADAETIRLAQQEAGKVQVSQDLIRYISALVKATRERPDIEAGVSPRGTLALLHASQSLAFLEGRSYVVPEDITRLAVSVCAHRLVLTRHIGRTAGQKAVMEDVLRTVAVPTEQFGRKSDALNAALTSDSPRAQLSRDVLNTLAGEDADSIGD